MVAGEVITGAVRDSGVRLLPVDSEHNAIFQCLEGRPRENREADYPHRLGRAVS